MRESLSLHRLQEASIVRSVKDNGTLFHGDATFDQNASVRNFSEAQNSACRVSVVRQSFSSHAGTHADTPAHFKVDEKLPILPDDLYSGQGMVIDVSAGLRSDMRVTRAVLEDALAAGKIDPAGAKAFLLRTNAENFYSGDPRQMFPHLTKDGAEFLVNAGTQMVGIDTPSVDHPEEKCLSGAVHGLLYDARTAIVENVGLRKLRTGRGEVATMFDPARSFVDARGISQMYFFPNPEDANR